MRKEIDALKGLTRGVCFRAAIVVAALLSAMTAGNARATRLPGSRPHPGHTLIIVVAGTVTEYQGHDCGCMPHVYTKGMAFIDPHDDQAHIIRNGGDAAARNVAIQLIPAGLARRIDFADPGNCHF